MSRHRQTPPAERMPYLSRDAFIGRGEEHERVCAERRAAHASRGRGGARPGAGRPRGVGAARLDLVAHYRSLLAAGRYHVDADAVAQAILDQADATTEHGAAKTSRGARP